jgi:hypothetical protein
MRNDDYYSIRTGKKTRVKLDLNTLKQLFISVYNELRNKDYLYEYMGYWCTDAGDVPGLLGDDDAIASRLLFKIGSNNLWPIEQNIGFYTEDDVFDMIEFLYDCISVPSDGIYHPYNNCGYHEYKAFDKEAARQEYQLKINEILAHYSSGYELSEQGCILILVERGFDNLLEAAFPDNIEDSQLIQSKINHAVDKYRRGRKIEERRDGIRELADILELLRPKIKELNLKQDESDIFNLLNNFGIRHFNSVQKNDYDASIFYSALFYHFLSMLHMCIRLMDRNED